MAIETINEGLEEEFEKTFLDDATTHYLKQISKFPLLNRDEERALTLEIFKLQTLLSQIVVSEKEGVEGKLERLIQKMANSNLRLVVKIAKKYHGIMEFSDIIQEGNIGLMIAIEKFNPYFNYKFSTYAVWWIEQAILRGIEEKGETIRFPAHIRKGLNDMGKAIEKADEDSDENTRDALLKKQYSENKIQKIFGAKKLKNLPSLDDFVSNGEGKNITLGDITVDSSPSPESEALSNNLREKLDQILDELPEKESAVLKLRLGWDGNAPQTLEQIGKKFGVSRERIRQLEGRAVKKLKHPAKTEKLAGLKEYLEE